MKQKTRIIAKDASKRLLEVRLERGLTPGQMAEKLGITDSSVHKAERGVQFFGFNTLKRFSLKFNCSIDWLLFNRGPKYLEEKISIAELQQQLHQLKESYEEQIASLHKNLADEKSKNKILDPDNVSIGGPYNPAVNKDVKDLLNDFEKSPELFYEVMLLYKKHLRNADE